MRSHWLPLGVPLLVPLLFGFTPFTRVVNVCPSCQASKSDVLVLTNGFKVKGNLVAQNKSYYVVERFGEYRAVQKKSVASVKWKDKGGAADLGTGDQILLKNNVVLHGAITKEQGGRYLEIQVGPLKHVVWSAQIQSVHKGGVPYTIPNK